MTANTNDFVPFATGVGALTYTPTAYEALAAVATGFQVGIADPGTFNTAMRQVSTVAAMIGQFTANFGTGNVQDNGNISTLLSQFEAALNGLAQLGGGISADDTGTANTIVITPAPAITAYAKYQRFLIKLANSITGASTINVNGVGAVALTRSTGSATQRGDGFAGEILEVVYDGTEFQIVGLTSQSPGTILYIVSTQTITVPAGCTRARIKVWGAGGGGGGSNGAGGGGAGGGGGGYVEGYITGLVPGASIVCTLGAQGAGGLGGSGETNGSAGGASSFGSFATANGGTGGGFGNGGPQQSVLGAGGTTSTSGMASAIGLTGQGGTGAFALASSVVGGSGGSNVASSAAGALVGSSSGIGEGGFLGCGGGGGINGGAGGLAGGSVIIVEFYP